jgi:hypothetical protein
MTSSVGEVTRAWRSSVGVLGRDHCTDLGLGRPFYRGREPRLQLTGRPVPWAGRPGQSHGLGGRLFDLRMVLGHPECQQEVGPLGTPDP